MCRSCSTTSPECPDGLSRWGSRRSCSGCCARTTCRAWRARSTSRPLPPPSSAATSARSVHFSRAVGTVIQFCLGRLYVVMSPRELHTCFWGWIAASGDATLPPAGRTASLRVLFFAPIDSYKRQVHSAYSRLTINESLARSSSQNPEP